MWKIEKNDFLHDYFMAGAGLMMKILLRKRIQKRQAEIDSLYKIYDGPDVIEPGLGGLALEASVNPSDTPTSEQE